MLKLNKLAINYLGLLSNHTYQIDTNCAYSKQDNFFFDVGKESIRIVKKTNDGTIITDSICRGEELEELLKYWFYIVHIDDVGAVSIKDVMFDCVRNNNFRKCINSDTATNKYFDCHRIIALKKEGY